MKLQALMIAVALVAGSALAQSYGTGSSSGSSAPMASPQSSSSSAAAADTGMNEKSPASTQHKMSKKHHVHHASAKHQRHHHMASAKHERHMASAHHERHHMAANAHHERHHMASARMDRSTRALGAGPASPTTDLNAADRQSRMDSAYSDWQRLQSRR